MTIQTKNGVAIIQSDEPVITNTQSALDLIAAVKYETGCEHIAIYKSAFAEDFFILSTGLAGEILQKFVTYHVGLAIIGDFSRYTSRPLRDFIYECNNGSHVFFVGTAAAAVAKLTGGYSITKALESDVEEILRLQYVAYQSEAELYGDFSIQPLTQTLDEAMLEFQKSVVLKAVLKDVIIGSVRARERNDFIVIGKLMVAPECQNRGVGKALLSAIEEEFPGRRFELFTGTKSVKNIALYEKHGYIRFKTEETASGFVFVYLEKPCAYRLPN